MNKKTSDSLMIILFILVIIFMAFVVFYMISNKEAFTRNPFVYGASRMEGDVFCSCIMTYGELEKFPVSFYFNNTNFWSGTDNFNNIVIK